MSEAVAARGIERYRALLRVPHARELFLWALLARLPMGMVPLALVLLVRDSGAGYGQAGAIVGAYLVAAAVGSPIAGRLVDRRGHARILRPRALLFPGLLLLIGALAVLDAPTVAIGASAIAAGVLFPPVGASLRSLWPRLLEEPELRAAAYALEASLQEVFFVVGPLLVAVVAGIASPSATFVVAAAASAIGTFGFVSSAPVRDARPEEEQGRRSLLGALESPGVRTVVLISACCGFAFGGVEVAVPAFAEAHGGVERAGIPLALFAAGSLVGGLVAGARISGSSRTLLRASALLLALGLAPPLLAGSLPLLSLLLFTAGLPIAPLFTAAYGLVDRAARRESAAEAFAWISTAISGGLAAGAAVGGALIDAQGVRASFALGCSAAALAALLALVGPGLEGTRPPDPERV